MSAQAKKTPTRMQDGLLGLPAVAPRVQKLSDSIYDILCENIVNGTLAPGQRLREAEVAASLDVSRTPVREAFALLEMQHLLDRDPTGAYLVSEWDHQMLWEVATLRGTLEGMAMSLVCERIKAADFDYLQSLIMQMEAATLRKDYDALIELDIQFHSYLWDQTGHNLLCETLSAMKAQVRFFMYLTRSGDEDTYGSTHQELLDTLRQGDPERVKQAIKEHILVTAERAIARMSAEE